MVSSRVAAASASSFGSPLGALVCHDKFISFPLRTYRARRWRCSNDAVGRTRRWLNLALVRLRDSVEPGFQRAAHQIDARAAAGKPPAIQLDLDLDGDRQCALLAGRTRANVVAEQVRMHADDLLRRDERGIECPRCRADIAYASTHRVLEFQPRHWP